MRQSINRVLVPLAYTSIFDQSHDSDADIKAWIAQSRYYLDQDISTKRFGLRAFDSGELSAALGNDTNRLAIAAFESICGVTLESVLKRSGAWGLIRCYYSSFFCAHAILRIYGRAPVYLDQPYANFVFKMSQLVGKSGTCSRLEKGLFLAKFANNFTEVHFERLADAHKDTWASFSDLLTELRGRVHSSTALTSQKLDALNLIDQLKSILSNKSSYASGNWMSAIRNEVNYRNGYGLWFPYQKSDIHTKYLNQISAAWATQDISLIELAKKSDIELFFEMTILLNRLLIVLLLGCVEKAGGENYQFKQGCFRLLRQINAV